MLHVLGQGHAPDGESAGGRPLWRVCHSQADDDDRLAIAKALLDRGASLTNDSSGETALHAAARRGPLALVELLIAHGAIEWQPDRKGRCPLTAAEEGSARDRTEIIELLDCPVVNTAAMDRRDRAPERGSRLADAQNLS